MDIQYITGWFIEYEQNILYNLIKSKNMSNNFKYEDYEDEDFQLNPSTVKKQEEQSAHKTPPETIKMLSNQKQKQKQKQKPAQKQPKKQIQVQVKPNDTKGKLIDQHVKLKSQLKELASKMDQILEKQRERKKRKMQGNAEDQDERIVQMKKKLKDDQIKMQKIRSQIARLRKNMDSKYDMNKIVDKQNEYKHLKQQLKTLEQQKQSLSKIRKTQDKAIKNSDDQQSKTNKQRMQMQLKQIQAQTKKLLDTVNEKQKQVRKLHENYITKSQKVKEIQMKLAQKKKSSQDEITPDAIAKLEQQLKQIQSQRAQIQKQGNQKIRNLQKQRKQLKNEQQRKKLILQQKQKQLRLNQMKHKQILRLINSSQQQQIINQSRVEKQNKAEGKRVVPKKGRQVPNMQIDGEEEQNDKPVEKPVENVEKDKEEKPKPPSRHQYGFSANLEDEEGIIDD